MEAGRLSPSVLPNLTSSVVDLGLTELIVEIDENEGIATVTFNRPKTLNSMSYRVYQELVIALGYLGAPAKNENVRVVVLKGNGKAFSSGLDLLDVNESFNEKVEEHGPDVARKGLRIHDYIVDCQNAISSVEKCRVPVIAAIHGY